MKALVFLCLLTFLPQQNTTEPTVAIILARPGVSVTDPVEGSQIVIEMKESEARTEYDRLAGLTARTFDEDRMLRALNNSLGTLYEIRETSKQSAIEDQKDREILRIQQEEMRVWMCKVGNTAWCTETQPERTVPLIFRDRVEIVKLSQAKAEYNDLFTKHCRFGGPFGNDLICETMTEAEQKRFTALTFAIGTLPNNCTQEQVFAQLCGVVGRD